MNTNNAYKEVARWEKELETTAVPVAEGKEGHKEALFYIIEQLFREIELEIFQRDSNGELKYGNNGRPKINWVNVITNLGKLVGKIIFLHRAFTLMKT